MRAPIGHHPRPPQAPPVIPGVHWDGRGTRGRWRVRVMIAGKQIEKTFLDWRVAAREYQRTRPPRGRPLKPVPLKERELADLSTGRTFEQEAAQLRKLFKARALGPDKSEKPFVRCREPKLAFEHMAARLSLTPAELDRLRVPHGLSWRDVCRHLAARLDRGEPLPFSKDELI